MWFPSWFWLALTGTHLVFALKCSVTYINKANYEFLFFKENGINNWLAESQPRAKQNTGVYCFMRISSSMILGHSQEGGTTVIPIFQRKKLRPRKVRSFY